MSDDSHDSLAAELAAAAPRRWWNRGTLVLGGIALVLGGFLGGLQVQKNFGATATTAAARPDFQAGGFGAQGRANPSAAPTTAPGTSGTVKLVDGTTLYVQTADGTVVTVRTGDDTTVRAATESSVKDVKAGDKVAVQGAADADGTVTATEVTSTR